MERNGNGSGSAQNPSGISRLIHRLSRRIGGTTITHRMEEILENCASFPEHPGARPKTNPINMDSMDQLNFPRWAEVHAKLKIKSR